MRKLFVLLLLGFAWVGTAEAAGSNRGAKAMHAINYTVQFSTISTRPAVLYEVILTTPAAVGDYFVAWDSNTAVGYTASVAGSNGQRLRMVITTTTAAGYVYQFDPPLQFDKGIVAGLSSAANAVTFVYEVGRVTQGY